MSFWNPWDTKEGNESSAPAHLVTHNPNESLSRLASSEIFNNLDTSNLNEKLTFLDDSCDLLGTTINEQGTKNLNDTQQFTETRTMTIPHQQIKNEPTNQQEYLQKYNAQYLSFQQPQYTYLADDSSYSAYSPFTNINNLRPSSVLSTISTSDYNSDFDSSISSTGTSRYSPNVYYQQVNNNKYQLSSAYSTQTYSDINSAYLLPYGNEIYNQPIDTNNYYCYNNLNQFKYVQPTQQVSSQVKTELPNYPVYNQMTKSQSNQSFTSSTNSSQHNKILNTTQPVISLQNIRTETDLLTKQKINDLSKKKTTLNNIQGFKYPTTTKMNPNIKINLQDIDLWTQFKQIGTEMILTKPGRRMFPVLRFSLSGLDKNKRYIVFVDIVPINENESRFKYHPKSGWVNVGKSEPHVKGLAYIYPDSPILGSVLMEQIVSFHKIKLTNSLSNSETMITLNSMHKYIPRLHIIEEGESITTFNIEDCSFIAVTSYQNDMITKLKIQHNPYAKGFKEHVYKDNEKNQKGRRPEYDNLMQSRNLSTKPKLA